MAGCCGCTTCAPPSSPSSMPAAARHDAQRSSLHAAVSGLAHQTLKAMKLWRATASQPATSRTWPAASKSPHCFPHNQIPLFTPAGRPQVHKEEDAMGCWNPLWCSCWACCRAPQWPAPGGPACIPEAMSAAARSPVLLAATQTFTRRSSKDLKTKQPASCTAYMPVLRPSCWQQPP